MPEQKKAATLSFVETAFRENKRSLRRFLHRFLDCADDVDDLLQDTFLRVYRAEGSTRIDAPRAFLFKTARNLALNELAKSKIRQTGTVADFNTTAVLETGDTPEQQAIFRQQLDQAFAAIEALTPRVRQVFELRKFHGLKQKEIATQLGISESTVEKHIAKGLHEMTRVAAREDKA